MWLFSVAEHNGTIKVSTWHCTKHSIITYKVRDEMLKSFHKCEVEQFSQTKEDSELI